MNVLDLRESDGLVKTDLLRCEIIANDFLETLANALFRNGIEVAPGENRVDNPGISLARICRHYCAKSAKAL